MVPTQAARVFASEISLSFDRIIAAATACGRPEARRILRVSAPSTFAMRWLIPRLERFHAERPEAEVAVTTTTTLHDELRGGFDVAVRRGSAEPTAWPQYQVTPFLDEADTLVMCPALFDHKPINKPEDLIGHIFLASETRPGDWADWLDHAGLSHMAGQRRRIFDHFFVTLQAIMDGLGIGIGPFPILAGDVAGGRLMTPFPEIILARTGYVALVPFDADKTASLTAFVEWLVAEGKQR